MFCVSVSDSLYVSGGAAAAGRPSYPGSGSVPPSPVALYASSLGLPGPLFTDGPLSLPSPLLGSPPATSPEAMYRAGAFDFDVNRRRGRRPRPDGTSAPKRKSRDGECPRGVSVMVFWRHAYPMNLMRNGQRKY